VRASRSVIPVILLLVSFASMTFNVAATSNHLGTGQAAPVLVIFQYNGVDSDAAGTILLIDTATYTYQDLPVSFTWTPGESHRVSVTRVVPAGADKQYVFSSWIDGGTLTAITGIYTVQVSSPQVVTLLFKTQYTLRMSAEPAGAGTLTPQTGTDWYDANAQVQISATASRGYSFLYWTSTGVGGFAGSAQHATVTVRDPIVESAHFNVTVPTTALVNVTLIAFTTLNTSGKGFISVDGQQIQTPQTFDWVIGTTHVLAANSPVSCGSGCQYVWMSWSDGGEEFHAITVPKEPATYVATYKTQYSFTVTVTSATGGVTNPPAGGSWQDEKSKVEISATTLAGYTFRGWVGTGDGSYTGMDAAHTLNVTGPMAEAASFELTGIVTVTVAIQLGNVKNATGTVAVIDDRTYTYTTLPQNFNWTTASNHTLFVQTQLTDPLVEKRYVFQSWSNNTGLNRSYGTYTAPNSSTTIIANYQTQYFVTVNATIPDANITVTPASQDGWYPQGARLHLTASGGGQLAGWIVDGTQVPAAGNQTLTIVVDKPTSVTAVYSNQANYTPLVYAVTILAIILSAALLQRRRTAIARAKRAASRKKQRAANILQLLESENAKIAATAASEAEEPQMGTELKDSNANHENERKAGEQLEPETENEENKYGGKDEFEA